MVGLDGVDHTFVGEPQEEGMMQYRSSFSLITKLRLSNPVGLKEGLARCQRCRLQQLTWICTQSQTNYFAPTKQKGCQSLRLAEHKELNVQMIKVKYDQRANDDEKL